MPPQVVWVVLHTGIRVVEAIALANMNLIIMSFETGGFFYLRELSTVAGGFSSKLVAGGGVVEQRRDWSKGGCLCYSC